MKTLEQRINKLFLGLYCLWRGTYREKTTKISNIIPVSWLMPPNIFFWLRFFMLKLITYVEISPFAKAKRDVILITWNYKSTMFFIRVWYEYFLHENQSILIQLCTLKRRLFLRYQVKHTSREGKPSWNFVLTAMKCLADLNIRVASIIKT